MGVRKTEEKANLESWIRAKQSSCFMRRALGALTSTFFILPLSGADAFNGKRVFQDRSFIEFACMISIIGKVEEGETVSLPQNFI